MAPRGLGFGVIGSSGVSVDDESIRGNSWQNGASPGACMMFDRRLLSPPLMPAIDTPSAQGPMACFLVLLQSGRQHPPQLQRETGVHVRCFTTRYFRSICEDDTKAFAASTFATKGGGQWGRGPANVAPMRKRIWAGGKRQFAIIILGWDGWGRLRLTHG